MPGLAIVGGVVVVVVSTGTYANGKVAIVALEGLGLIGTIGTTSAADIPALSAILTHEEVEVLAIVGLTVYEA